MLNKKYFSYIISILIVLITISGYFIYDLKNKNNNLKIKIDTLEKEVKSTKDSLNISETDNNNLTEALDTEQRRNENFEKQIEDLADTVGILDKLRKIDPELLQKYSKVYFLNEHYTPEKLSNIDNEWIAEGKSNLQIEYRVNKHLEDLLEDAKDDDINLRIISAYRGFFEQQALKSAYTVNYGSGANAFSADQGYSEHQLGTAVDFSTEELGLNYTSIENTEADEWL